MLHRAILGSMERWIGILIEQYAGRMPGWLAPVQLVVAAITDNANGYAEQVAAAAVAAGLRVETDLRNEKNQLQSARTQPDESAVYYCCGRPRS